MVCEVGGKRWRKLECVLGGFCAMCISGQYYIVGNVGTYLESYLMERGNYSQESSWLISALITTVFVGGQVGMVIGGYLDRAIGAQLTTLMGLGLMLLGTTLTCWTVHVSTVATVVTFGAIPSLGFGWAYGSPYSALNKHKFENLGLMYGIVNSGFGGGAVVFNVVISAFINPENRAPDKVHAHGIHFSQAVILDRIPFSFLLLGGLYAVLLPVAVWGMRTPPSPAPESEYAEIALSVHQPLPATLATKKSYLKGDKCPTFDENFGQETYQTMRSQEDLLKTTKKTQRETDSRGGKERGEGGQHGQEDLSPQQMVLHRTFYVVWITMFLSFMSNNTVVGYYKELGLSHIQDDMLLASMGTVGSLLSALGRLLWGLMIDYTSFQTTLVVQLALTCVCVSWWREVLLWSSGLFYVFTVLLFALVSAFPILITVAVKGYFGQTCMVANLSVLWTAMTLESILQPFITSLTLEEYGWDGLIILLSVVTFAGMLVSLLLPRDLMLVSDIKNADDNHT